MEAGIVAAAGVSVDGRRRLDGVEGALLSMTVLEMGGSEGRTLLDEAGLAEKRLFSWTTGAASEWLGAALAVAGIADVVAVESGSAVCDDHVAIDASIEWKKVRVYEVSTMLHSTVMFQAQVDDYASLG